MAEPTGTADVDKVEVEDEDEDQDDLDSQEMDAAEESEEPEEPPRRRLVSELLEGQEEIDEAARADLQLVAPPLHVEPIEAGQSIYQLDLSGGEPEGTLVEPEGAAPQSEHGAGGLSFSPTADAADARSAVRALIAERDRAVMAAERDVIGAYNLATAIDEFVDAIFASIRQFDDD